MSTNDPISTNDPVFGIANTEIPTETRINGLDALTDENISLSMNFAVDFPSETFKMSFLQLVNYIKSEVLNAQYLVGDIIIGSTTDTPAARGLTGTWSPVEQGTVLNAVSLADPSLGTITGSNEKAVPLLAHNHNASFSGNALANHNHTFTGNSMGTHKHGNGQAINSTTNANGVSIYGYTASTGTSKGIVSGMAGQVWEFQSWTESVSAGTPSGSIGTKSAGTPSGSVTVNSSGDIDPKINVQGKALNVIFWRKTAL